MRPDSNHNEIIETKDDMLQKMNGVHKEAAVPEEVLNNNGLTLRNFQRVPTTGGSAEEIPNEFTSAKAAVGGQLDDDEKIREYLQRSDTAVIYPEPVGRVDNGK